MLDSLRQLSETGRAVISRANRHLTYPARFQLVAAMNPCRCGYLADLARARARQSVHSDGLLNARVDGAALTAVCALDRDGDTLLRAAAEALQLSARGYHRVLRVARTIADLEAGGDTA